MEKLMGEIEPRSVEISFGTIFTVRQHEGRVDVILNVGKKGSSFFSGQLRTTADGLIALTNYGTGEPRYFGEVVGIMTLDEVIEAARIGARDQGYELSDRQRASFQESAQKGPRILNLE